MCCIWNQRNGGYLVKMSDTAFPDLANLCENVPGNMLKNSAHLACINTPT